MVSEKQAQIKMKRSVPQLTAQFEVTVFSFVTWLNKNTSSYHHCLSAGVIISKRVCKMETFVSLHSHTISDVTFRCSRARTTVKSGDDTVPKTTPLTPAASSDTHNERITSPRQEKECNPPNKDVFTMADWDNMLFSLLHMPLIHSVLHSLTVTRSAENKPVSFPHTAGPRHWRQGRFATTIMCKIWSTYCNCSLVFSPVVGEIST